MLRKVSKARAAAPETQREAAPPSPAPTGQEGRARRETRKRPLPNREMLWINRDFVSDPKPPAAAPAPATVPDPFRQEKSTPGYENRGLLSTIRYLDFSDVNASGPPDSAAPDDLGSLIDNANEIDWVSKPGFFPVVFQNVDSTLVYRLVLTAFLRCRTWSIRIC